MSGIALDASKVNSYVLPKLDKTNSTMQEAYSASLSLKSSLPGSFSYRGMVSDISAQITEVRKEVTQVKKVVTSKVELAKRIESKSESKIASLVGSAGKIGSIIGSAAGAIKGGAAGSLLGPLGAAAGAVTGAIAGGVTGTLMGKTGAKVAAKTVSGVKKVGSWLWNGIKNVGAKVVKGVKSIAGKVVSGAKKIGNAVKTVAKKTWTAVKNTGAKIVNGATKVVKSIWNGVKSAGKWLWNGCKKVVKSAASFVEKKALPFIKNVVNLRLTINNRVGASIVNLTISLVKGVCQFGEALVDGVVMILGGVASAITGIIDGCQAIYGAITGKEWHSCTKAMWSKGIMPFVSTEYVKGVANSLYETKFGKWLDNNAYGWFKSNGIACDLGSGVGYIAGIALLTIATAGIGTAVTGGTTVASGAATVASGAATAASGAATASSLSTTLSTAFAAIGATGKSANKSFKKLKEKYGNFDKITGKEIAKAVTGSYISGAIEGVTWYFTYGKGSEALKTGVGKLSDVKVISKIATTMNAKMGIQFTKTIANSQAEAYSTGTKVNWGETLFDAAVNAGVAGIYEKFGTNGVKSVSGKLTNLYDARALAKNEKMLKKVIEDGGFDAVDAVDDIVLNIRQEVVKSTIENGTKKVGGKVVKGSYTTIIEEIKKRLVPNTN